MALPLLGILNTSLGLAKQEKRIENALARAADLSHDADSVRGDDANRDNDYDA